MIFIIGICIGLASILEVMSYWKQITKTCREHDSKEVSSSSYFLKLWKYFFALIALVLAHNWVGVALEVVALIMCAATTFTIVRHKPKGWRM